MSDPWPKRDYYEDDMSYVISMVRELFVEIAQVKAMLEKHQINVPPMDEMMSTVPLHPLTRSMYGDTNDRSDDVPVNSSLKDEP